MKDQPKYINQVITDIDCRFVFPSEVTAASWRRTILTRHSTRAVRSDRFISWDKFKELLFRTRRDKRPINNIQRQLFAEQLLTENSKEPFLSYIISKDAAPFSGSFTQYLTRLLPVVHRVISHGKFPAVLPADLQQDLNRIEQRYSTFLESIRAFEPSREKPDTASLTGRWKIVFPELITDFTEFAPVLKRSPLIEYIPAPKPERYPSITVFRNSFQEYRFLFRRIEELINRGIHPADISVSAGDMDTAKPAIQELALLNDIGVTFRSGDPLGSSLPGRMFTMISQVLSGNFHLDSLKNLLLNQGIPWIDSEGNRSIITRLLKSGYIKAPPGGFRPGNWNIIKDLEAVKNASGFSELRKSIYRFINRHIDSDMWDPESLHTLQSIMDTLNDLVLVELDNNLTSESPLAMMLNILSAKRYVPKTDAELIPFYAYRPAAGIYPEFHFVTGCSESASRVLANPFSFLREDLSQSMGFEGNDLSNHYLSVYAGSGKEVRFSYSAEGFSGPQLAPPVLLEKGEVKEPEPEDIETLYLTDSYFGEQSVWYHRNMENDFTLKLLQYSGANKAFLTSLNAKTADYTAETVTDGNMKQRVLSMNQNQEDRLSEYSSTKIETFTQCPFRFLLIHLLGIAADEYALKLDSPLDFGSLYHEIAARLFSRSLSEKNTKAVIHEVISENTTISPQVLNALLPQIEKEIHLLATQHQNLYGSHESAGREKSFSMTVPDKFRITGRIDHLLLNKETNNYTVLDYKLKNVPAKGDILGSKRSEPCSFQLPLYMALIEDAGLPAGEAAYYSFKKGKFTHLLAEKTKSWINHEEKNGLIQAALEKVELVHKKIHEGDLRCPDPVTGCETGCDLRNICRKRYSTT
ncbi:MAG: PD-(D/E)XK nuclease family protein [Spirochaetia bacterium]